MKKYKIKMYLLTKLFTNSLLCVKLQPVLPHPLVCSDPLLTYE